MIVLIEPVCSSWIHEEVNAGFLQLIANNTKDEILYIGEERQIQCVRRIYANARIRFIKIKNMVAIDKADDYGNVFYYIGLLMRIVRKYNPEKLFILCGYRPCLLAADIVAVLHRKVWIWFVVHGMVEGKKGHKEAYARLFHLGGHCKNLHFMTYSPYCTGAYWGMAAEKFVFLDHPYVMEGYKAQGITSKPRDKLVIGVIGACANDKAAQIISLINRRKPGGAYEFWVVSKHENRFRHFKNVKVFELEFSRENKRKFMRDMDYLLLPYGRDEYAVSASGVLWDAAAHKLPCFMLDCQYFKYYMPHQIGYQANSIKGLSDVICEKIERRDRRGEARWIHMNQIECARNETMRQILRA